MSHELFYTSVPAGLKAGSRGFCTVAITQNLSAQWADRLELLSGYRFAFDPAGPQASLNPVQWAHWRVSIGGKTRSILSRIANAGADYSGRSNKFAHHLVLEPSEQSAGGPAWLMRQPGLMESRWSGEPRMLPQGKSIPPGNREGSICKAWAAATGDPGWAGVLAESFLKNSSKSAVVLCRPDTDVLALFEEALALLPEPQRWQVTFNTFFNDLPAGMTCNWRGVLADSATGQEAIKQSVRVTVIDATSPSTSQDSSALVEFARTGKKPGIPIQVARQQSATGEDGDADESQSNGMRNAPSRRLQPLTTSYDLQPPSGGYSQPSRIGTIRNVNLNSTASEPKAGTWKKPLISALIAIIVVIAIGTLVFALHFMSTSSPSPRLVAIPPASLWWKISQSSSQQSPDAPTTMNESKSASALPNQTVDTMKLRDASSPTNSPTHGINPLPDVSKDDAVTAAVTQTALLAKWKSILSVHRLRAAKDAPLVSYEEIRRDATRISFRFPQDARDSYVIQETSLFTSGIPLTLFSSQSDDRTIVIKVKKSPLDEPMQVGTIRLDNYRNLYWIPNEEITPENKLSLYPAIAGSALFVDGKEGKELQTILLKGFADDPSPKTPKLSEIESLNGAFIISANAPPYPMTVKILPENDDWKAESKNGWINNPDAPYVYSIKVSFNDKALADASGNIKTFDVILTLSHRTLKPGTLDIHASGFSALKLADLCKSLNTGFEAASTNLETAKRLQAIIVEKQVPLEQKYGNHDKGRAELEALKNPSKAQKDNLDDLNKLRDLDAQMLNAENEVKQRHSDYEIAQIHLKKLCAKTPIKLILSMASFPLFEIQLDTGLILPPGVK